MKKLWGGSTLLLLALTSCGNVKVVEESSISKEVLETIASIERDSADKVSYYDINGKKDGGEILPQTEIPRYSYVTYEDIYNDSPITTDGKIALYHPAIALAFSAAGMDVSLIDPQSVTESRTATYYHFSPAPWEEPIPMSLPSNAISAQSYTKTHTGDYYNFRGMYENFNTTFDINLFISKDGQTARITSGKVTTLAIENQNTDASMQEIDLVSNQSFTLLGRESQGSFQPIGILLNAPKLHIESDFSAQFLNTPENKFGAFRGTKLDLRVDTFVPGVTVNAMENLSCTSYSAAGCGYETDYSLVAQHIKVNPVRCYKTDPSCRMHKYLGKEKDILASLPSELSKNWCDLPDQLANERQRAKDDYVQEAREASEALEDAGNYGITYGGYGITAREKIKEYCKFNALVDKRQATKCATAAIVGTVGGAIGAGKASNAIQEGAEAEAARQRFQRADAQANSWYISRGCA